MIRLSLEGRIMRVIPVVLLLALAPQVPPPVPATVLVGVVTEVQSREVQDQGNRYTTSTVTVAVAEVLKGRAEDTVTVEVVGGTVNGITMQTSDAPLLTVGDRAVFSLDSENRPIRTHGTSIYVLDAKDHLRGSPKTLEDVRKEVKR
jgi:hypothetical protein